MQQQYVWDARPMTEAGANNKTLCQKKTQGSENSQPGFWTRAVAVASFVLVISCGKAVLFRFYFCLQTVGVHLDC